MQESLLNSAFLQLLQSFLTCVVYVQFIHNTFIASAENHH